MLIETATFTKAIVLFFVAVYTSGVGFGVAMLQFVTGDSVVGEIVAGGSVATAFLVGRWSWKVLKEAKAIADADRDAALARERLLREENATAWQAIANLRAKLAQTEDRLASETRLRLALEEAGVKDRRHYGPPDGVPI